MSARKRTASARVSEAPSSGAVAKSEPGPTDLDIAMVAISGAKPNELDAKGLLGCALATAKAQAVQLADRDTEDELAYALVSRLEAIAMLVDWRLEVEFKAGAA